MSDFLKNGEMFSGCKILSRCGKGSFGVTYLARNPIGQNIIVKAIALNSCTERELSGLRNYMQVSGRHPNLLKIFHIGNLGGYFYYTMEAADNLEESGEYYPATLGNMLRQGRRFAPDEAVAIIRELLDGVEAMHNAKLLHRDIKPDNIIFVEGRPKLSDPGLVVEFDEKTAFAGTPGFIPPEVIEKALPPDCTWDLYALGKVFYCMTTGCSARKFPLLPEDIPVNICRQLVPLFSRMCDQNASRRFRTIAEFRAGLPRRFEGSTPLSRLWIEFRDWRTLNPFLFRVLAAVVLLLLLLAAGTLYSLRQRRLREEKEIARLQNEVRSFLAINRERRNLVALQLETAAPDSLAEYRRLFSAMQNARRGGDWKNAAAFSTQLRQLLLTAAQKIQPPIPEKEGSFKEDFNISGIAHSFIASPLAQYLGDHLEKYKRALEQHDRKTFVSWAGPRSGKNWESFQYYYSPMIFVPAGAVKMQHSRKTVRIPYHFWICKNETLHEHFTRIMGIAPQRSSHANTPVERVSWNDALCYCYFVTVNLQSAGVLPPGYIVRPPNEAEWEYAANNGWLGNDTTPLEERAVVLENSGKRTHSPGAKAPSKLGLNDIYGNVQELVLPIEENAMHHSVLLRGGSFLNRAKKCYSRIPYQKYQCIPYNVGFRFVIAPGDMTFFDKHFFAGGPAQKKINGKVYELIGANISAFNGENSQKFCQLLGGNLAEIEDQKLFDLIVQKFPLAASSWGCFVGGRKIGGQWKWLRSGKAVDYGSWIRSRADDDGIYLTIRSKRWKGEKNYYSGIFLCEWDEKEYPERNKQLKSGKKLPCELMRFALEEREFMLIQSNMLFCSAARVCELLGGRLAVLDTPALRSKVMEKLKAYSDHKILLGGYAKREKWYWLNGKEIEFPLKKHPDILIPSVNRNYVVLQNGQFYNSQFSSLFLCEWRKNSISLK